MEACTWGEVGQLAAGNAKVRIPLEISLAVSCKHTHVLYPVISLLGIYPRKTKRHVHTKTYTQLSTLAFLVSNKLGDNPHTHWLLNDRQTWAHPNHGLWSGWTLGARRPNPKDETTGRVQDQTLVLYMIPFSWRSRESDTVDPKQISGFQGLGVGEGSWLQRHRGHGVGWWSVVPARHGSTFKSEFVNRIWTCQLLLFEKSVRDPSNTCKIPCDPGLNKPNQKAVRQLDT